MCRNLCKVSNSLKCRLFADDTNIFYTDESYENLFSVVNRELCKLNEWFRINKLTLKVSKTNYMLFGSKHRPGILSDKHTLKIDGTLIYIVSKTKFLCVIIDDTFYWSDHITYIQNKVAKSLDIMYRVKYYLNKESLLRLYNSLILPISKLLLRSLG